MTRYIKLDNIKIGRNQKYVFDVIEGIASGDVNYQEDTFAGFDGAEYSEIVFRPRQLQIKGTIIAKSQQELLGLKRQLIKQCNPKNRIDVYYYDGQRQYYCEAIADGLPDFSKRNEMTMTFVVYLKVPDFYWLTDSDIETPIYQSTPLLDADFTFPGMFSERIFETYVINDGEVAAWPKIVLTCEVPNTTDIVIKNVTSGKSIKLSHTMSADEEIVIDMEKGTVMSSINGSLLNKIDRLDNFWALEVGENFVRVETTNIYAIMLHRNKYIGV